MSEQVDISPEAVDALHEHLWEYGTVIGRSPSTQDARCHEAAAMLLALRSALTKSDAALEQLGAAFAKERIEAHEARSALTAAEKDRANSVHAIEALLDIAAMGKKAGSETAKNTLHKMGIDWETGEPLPNYRSMT